MVTAIKRRYDIITMNWLHTCLFNH
jgi:hypothetical protein